MFGWSEYATLSPMLKRTATRKTNLTFHASAIEAGVVLCAAQTVPDGEVPEWVHLLPAGNLRTNDGRGPYAVGDATQLMAESLPAGGRLILDENHATDLAGPRGEPAPARGWIVELQARENGIWGKVEWTPYGRRLISSKAYRGISPAIAHDKNMKVTAIRRASLVNLPNLLGLETLHQETSMTLLEKLRKALGLDDTTSEDALVTAVTTLHASQAESTVTLQAQLVPIAKAAGLGDDADAVAILGAVEKLSQGGGTDATVTALQSELATVTNKLNTLDQDTRKKAATNFVDAAIVSGKVGVKPLRDHYITMHMADPARVEKEIGSFPVLGSSGALTTPPAEGAEAGLTADTKRAIALMGISEADYKKTLAAEGNAETAL